MKKRLLVCIMFVMATTTGLFAQIPQELRTATLELPEFIDAGSVEVLGDYAVIDVFDWGFSDKSGSSVELSRAIRGAIFLGYDGVSRDSLMALVYGWSNQVPWIDDAGTIIESAGGLRDTTVNWDRARKVAHVLESEYDIPAYAVGMECKQANVGARIVLAKRISKPQQAMQPVAKVEPAAIPLATGLIDIDGGCFHIDMRDQSDNSVTNNYYSEPPAVVQELPEKVDTVKTPPPAATSSFGIAYRAEYDDWYSLTTGAKWTQELSLSLRQRWYADFELSFSPFADRRTTGYSLDDDESQYIGTAFGIDIAKEWPIGSYLALGLASRNKLYLNMSEVTKDNIRMNFEGYVDVNFGRFKSFRAAFVGTRNELFQGTELRQWRGATNIIQTRLAYEPLPGVQIGGTHKLYKFFDSAWERHIQGIGGYFEYQGKEANVFLEVIRGDISTFDVLSNREIDPPRTLVRAKVEFFLK